MYIYNKLYKALYDCESKSNGGTLAPPLRILSKIHLTEKYLFFTFRLPRIIVVYFLMRLQCKFIQTQYQRYILYYVYYIPVQCIQTVTKCSNALVWKNTIFEFQVSHVNKNNMLMNIRNILVQRIRKSIINIYVS